MNFHPLAEIFPLIEPCWLCHRTASFRASSISASNAWSTLIDGYVPQMPLAKGRYHYKKPHWGPGSVQPGAVTIFLAYSKEVVMELRKTELTQE
jgi:hypothetical protein